MIREKYGNSEGKCIRIKLKLKGVRHSPSRECCECDGDGTDLENDACNCCGRSSRENNEDYFFSYNDDSDISNP
jgi:hypothetical protein